MPNTIRGLLPMTEIRKDVEGVESGVTVEFWGVRGSLPTPGPDTVRYGGHTSCVSLAFGTGEHLILDAGTGIRRLGEALSAGDGDLSLLLSHNHWDHIQGFPFFAPLYQENRRIYLFPSAKGREFFCSLTEQMDGAHFPFTSDKLPSDWSCIASDQLLFLAELGLEVSRIAVNHPGGSSGVRIARVSPLACRRSPSARVGIRSRLSGQDLPGPPEALQPEKGGLP